MSPLTRFPLYGLVSLAISLLPWSQPCLAAASDAPAKTAGKVISVSGTVLIRTGAGKEAKSQLLRAGTYFNANDIINTPSNGTAKLLFNDKSIVDIGPSSLFHVQGFKANGGNDREVDVTMLYGSMRAAITKPLAGKGKFKVKTPTATMGVRGTEFVVKSDLGSMKEIAHGIQSPGRPFVSSLDLAGVKPETGAAASAPVPKMEVVVLQGKVNVETPQLQGSGGASGRAPASASVNLTAGQGMVADGRAGVPAAPLTLKPEQMKSVSASARVEDNTFKKAVVVDASTNLSGSSKDPSSSSSGAKPEKPEKSEKGGSSTASKPAAAAPAAVAAPAVTTAELVTTMVVDAVAPVVSAPASAPAPAPVVDPSSFIPITQTAAPVAIPAGGLKRVTIRVTR